MSNSILRAWQQQVASAFFATAMTVAILAGIGALATLSTGDVATLATAQRATVGAAV